MDSIRLTVSGGESSRLTVSEGGGASLSIGDTVIGGGIPYEGSYSVTPSQERQELRTAQRLMSYDVVVEPIPSNYGLITWNGSSLMVS